MIDPLKITNYERTDAQLQAFWLFCLFVAGKNSDYAARCLAVLLIKGKESPFEYLRSLGEHGVHNALVASKIGQYGRLAKAVAQSLDLDLRTATLQDLNQVYGAGPKTTRFFLLHTRPNQQLAVLDTHILAWLRSHQINAPTSTPSEPKYSSLEKIYITLANTLFPNVSLADVDLLIWSSMSGRLD